ncbi:MAG: cytochrome c biogenesis protein ResB, partial [Planctomycetota bacterium]
MPMNMRYNRGMGFSGCFIVIFFFGAAAQGMGRILPRFGGWALAHPAWAGLTLFLAGVPAVLALWVKREVVFRVLASLPFAVTLLSVILAATALGTFVPQGLSPEECRRFYGGGAIVERWFSLNDVFYSPWYTGFLGLLAASLVVVPVRNRAWRPALWGHGLAHLGMAAVLLGGAIGGGFGFRGRLDIREGEAVSVVPETCRSGKTGRAVPLGFSIVLRKFEVERRPPEYRFYVYRRQGDDWRVAKAFPVKKASSWQAVGGGFEFRLARMYPDFAPETRLAEAAPPRGRPGVEIEAGGIHRAFLDGDGGWQSVHAGGKNVLFRIMPDAPGPADIEGFRKGFPERHELVFTGDGGTEEILHVRPGGEFAAGGWKGKVVEFLPDFVMDPMTKKTFSRSDQPNNPAVWIAMTLATGGAEVRRWCFARMPEYHEAHGHGEDVSFPRLAYRYHPAVPPIADGGVVVMQTLSVLEIRAGAVAATRSLAAESGDMPGFPGVRYRIFPFAGKTEVPATRSGDMRHPAAEIEVRRNGETRIFP